MNKVSLKDLNMNSRTEVTCFLKRLWNNEKTLCPKCGNVLKILHKKAKKVLAIGNVIYVKIFIKH